uniref:Calpain catalytic domain-containing protein n=1 Tax=Monopterus albus TaxID=43700 RepID=A0A3Q3JEG5_MONAL
MPPPGVCLNIMEARYNESIAQPARLFNQDYQQLKQHCLQKRERYRDDMFPPDRSSIGEGLLEPSKLEIAPNPSFVLDGASRFDFGQGELGDCWFLASIGALTCQRHFLEWVVRLEQTFDKDYCGLFHFRFWRFGKWVDVVIDDKLPTIYGKLIFVHSKNRNEFWPALLEKAYAKVCGSYSDLSGGSLSEAMMDFTGGVHMCIQLSQPPSNLWDLMNRAGKYHTLMGCGTHHTPQGKTYANNELPNGLVSGHAYTVTGILSQRQVVNLVRLWNPWGHGEWKGDWSDSSVSMQHQTQKKNIISKLSDFNRMNLEDFCKSYVVLDICCSSPDFLDSNSPWETSIYEGKWIAGISAGGCIQNKDSFCTNPQYRVKIDGQYSEKHGDYNILVSLMQKPDKRNRHKVHLRNIGFCVFKAHRGMLPSSFFNTHAPLAKTYNKTREVMMFLLLTPGEYLIVPSTEKPNETASFILFIHSKAETHVRYAHSLNTMLLSLFVLSVIKK